MIIKQLKIKGTLGKTVCYSFPIRETTTGIIWDAFRFYSPAGTGDDGNKYFDIDAGSCEISRDSDLDQEIYLIVKSGVLNIYEVFEGASLEISRVGIEGDIIATGTIPANTGLPIIIEYKEVYCENQSNTENRE